VPTLFVSFMIGLLGGELHN